MRRIAKLPLGEIAEARLRESAVEAELAKKFLQAGLLRNAAGKAFQAWRAYLSYLSIKHHDLFRIEGYKALGGGASVPRREWILAVVPTSMLAKIAEALREKEPEVVELTALALIIYEYQYNGPDPTGMLSKIPDDQAARAHIERLVGRLEEKLTAEMGRRGS
ncbi:MAG: PaREP1 family protein [Thermoproteus sp.]